MTQIGRAARRSRRSRDRTFGRRNRRCQTGPVTSRQQLRVDTPETRRRLARLGRYVDTNLLRGNTFVCHGLCQCKGSPEATAALNYAMSFESPDNLAESRKMVVVHGIPVDRIPRRKASWQACRSPCPGTARGWMVQLAVGRAVDATSIAPRSRSVMPPHTPYGSRTWRACLRQC
jgi:hypothetical protein